MYIAIANYFKESEAVKLIRTTRLVRHQKQTVHVEIDLCQLPGSPERYLVNLRQGRAGEVWRDSTRTPQAVALDTAQDVFALAVRERTLQGFADADAAVPAPAPLPAAPQRAAPDAGRGVADQALLARLQAGPLQRMSASERTRTIWRVGERRLKPAVPVLIDLIEQSSPMQDYCVAWAIARCGDPGAAISMQALHTRGATDAVSRIAQQAWLQLIGPEALRRHADALIEEWPERLRALWATQDEAAVSDAIAQPGLWKHLSLSDWLEQLDQVALSQPIARRILLAQLHSLPVQAGVFRAMRHLYKAAECRDDGELFGLLHHRFETTPANVTGGSGWVQVKRRYVRFTEEAAKPDSAVAYSRLTRDYLRRRSWRTLRRLGTDADPAYVTMALGALRAMNDQGAGQQYQRSGRRYGPYSHWMLFNRMLRAHGPWRSNRNGRSWHLPADAAPANARQEAFPALWDARPDALLWLMQHSRCDGVHEFAARALIDNTAYCNGIALATLRQLLQPGSYRASAQFAFDLVRQRFEAVVPDTGWLLLLLQSGLPEAAQYVLDCVSRDLLHYSADALLVCTLLCAPDQAVRRQGRMLCQMAATLPHQPEAIVLQLLDWLDNSADLDDADNAVADIGADVLWLLEHALRAAAAQAPYERLLALLKHRLPAVQTLAADWLLRHAQPVSMIPAATLGALLHASDPQQRGIGVKLFSALPDHVLAAQPQLFAAFCTHPDAALRRAIDAPLQRLASAHPEFCAALLPELLDCLFRGETAAGGHADLLAWMQGPLKGALDALDRATLMRLLSARSKGAQQLGALLLPRYDAGQFEVAEWAALGRNENASVRHWACQAFSADPARARARMEDALRLFDSRWEDSRAFACEFFQSRCGAGDWNPGLLVNLCDHLDPAVQRFGRAMLGTHFDVRDVTEYMLKLSQHPSANMQLFVSGWLESAAAGDAACLRRLEPYFLSVLSQVNRGRVVKSRVLDFLRRQADESEDVAAFVATLFARQVLTVAIADKAHYIEGLRAIQQRYPNLPAALAIQPPRPPDARKQA